MADGACEVTERLDAFMARANAAYYATHDPFVDFVTAPEVSQVFGELLGLWAAVTWQLLGSPNPVLLVEAGPGRGTLMADALRAIERVIPAFASALRLHFIETSPRLRALQAQLFPQAAWHDELSDVPRQPFLLIANEFLDALPIRQFVRRADGWMERYVAQEHVEERCAEPDDLSDTWLDDPEGSVRETSPLSAAFVQEVTERCHQCPGAGLFIDYGTAQDLPGDSLQAIAQGRPSDPFHAAGEADLTAHVNFPALAAIAGLHAGAVHGPVAQGKFLARLGLFQRINKIASGLPPAQAWRMTQAGRRLGEPDQMGRLFKAMAITSTALTTCPGFEENDAGL
jgi:NADH dehydrogenase [ubiquinone] 1 alpha subcomplex assembly factor 7